MRIHIVRDYAEMSRLAARVVAEEITLRPRSVLGLATGETTLGLYQELIRLHWEEGLDFSEVRTFNLDEYIGVHPEDSTSYSYYMTHNFFRHINLEPANTFLPNSLAADIETECLSYEQRIDASGGIDLQVLGIGQNGHIGFNEPGTDFAQPTHPVQLADSTIESNARFFPSPNEVPRLAISMGLGTIMKARKILLLAHGSHKADAIYSLVCGAISPTTPASVLRLHLNVRLILEQSAARLISECAQREN